MPPLVVYNDAIGVQQLDSLIRKHSIHNIVISPGPGTPRKGQDVGEHAKRQPPMLMQLRAFTVCAAQISMLN